MLASADNLRLFNPVKGWVQFADQVDGDGKTISFGANRDIDLALSVAMNASNLMVLTGAGASFCAKNPAQGAPTAPGMSDLWTAVEAAATKETFQEVIDLIPKAKATDTNIEKLLTQCKIYVELFNNESSKKIQTFIETAEKAIAKRVSFVSNDTDIKAHGAIIRKIARRGVRKPRAKFFTTNYDLCFEYAARAQRFTIIDGFSHAMPQIYDRGHFSHDIVRRENAKEGPDYIENVFHLYKLHGSIDWKRRGADIVRAEGSEPPLLIFPRDSKYQEAFEPPYLDMMGAFQSSLREPDTALIVSGFGFNDDHLSKPVMAALEANMSLKLIVCDVAFLRDDVLEKGDHTIAVESPVREHVSGYFERFKHLARIGDQRITLLSGRFEDLALAIPDLVAQTERERHLDRMQAARGFGDGVQS
ncbi:SIR2 family protein [Rhizobium leguminosarum]|uniref:SIR2 family protein n=1 Tax=Rhizobium leguminosarum TaxID=384 RepID=UPI0021BC26AD|nr:SIR2 family protein [Rhizobium leguminosarum]